MYLPGDGHQYTFTITGKCSLCSGFEEAHVRMLETVPEPTVCPADHISIATHVLIGDAGLQWRPCPYCGVQVEGALRKGEHVGPDWGPGRGELSPRQKSRLMSYVGYIDHLGGGR